ncbi:MAG TPA: DNA-directed RNA polymerase subunit beta' [Patescibacteria group bacterium]|nr:DNA-directed RNA polymerase subunit beta' [Patescibacteria group bacterium]
MPAPSSVSTFILPKKTKPKTSFDFDSLRLSLASPEEIKKWSYGEVLEPETINYRTRKPERDGLFCQKIFGPVKDFQCACGKYKKIRYKGIVCDRCGVEVTRSLVRRERFGHIDLAAPVSHIWFLRGIPSKVGMVLGMSIKNIEKVVYFANFVIFSVEEDLKKQVIKKLKKEFQDKIKQATEEDIKERLKKDYKKNLKQIKSLKKKQLITEVEYRELSLKYGHVFNAGIGAEAISRLLQEEDLDKLASDIKKEKLSTKSKGKQKKLTKRLKFVEYFLKNDIKPEWMILKALPVVPPKLRPLVPLDGGRFASSDLNDLYRRVINRNNRLKKLYKLNAPEVILRNEKRMLQEAVDALIDNSKKSRKTTTSSTGQKRPLKSIADMLKGKQGRFRRNLLGKRVDYSGRSVIVVGPKLKMHQCGLPKVMAAELFKPFVASKLIKKEIVHNVHSANNLIDRGTEDVWDALDEVVKDSYVLLNRAPTLHRLGIQAYQPILIEGKAIQLHPLACAAFNADFDGDQMAVHVPITKQAQEEAKNIMLSTHNMLKPSSGEPIITPPKDMVWGVYYMTKFPKDEKKKQLESKEKGLNFPAFSDEEDAISAYEMKRVTINEKVLLRTGKGIITTSVGRIIFKNILPKGIYDMKEVVDQTKLKQIVSRIIEEQGPEKTAPYLDKIKKYSLKHLTMSGFSWGMGDLPNLKGKDKILKIAEKKVKSLNDQYEEGLLSEEEKHKKVVDTWMDAKEEITELVKKSLPHNTVYSMVESGARGSWRQLTQMFGMKGTVSSPTGKRMELPIKSAYKQGLDALEYFISTHGSRKGLADTALRTAKAGYLTRRLVDVAQDVIVREDDCGDEEGLIITRKGTKRMNTTWAERIRGRYAADTIKDPKTKKILARKNDLITKEKAAQIEKADPESLKIRSALTCKSNRGVCAKCYGYDLSYNKEVQVGSPVGVIAAQSIGEPGTQLTLRTFHSGGVAGEDITQGLPRAEQLFEARSVKKRAVLAHGDGKVKILDESGNKKLVILYDKPKKNKKAKNKKGKDIKKKEHDVSGFSLWVKDGDRVKKGDQLTDGHIDLEELYKLKGKRAVEKYILREIQYIYSSHGQTLNEKHIEIIIKKMFSRCMVIESGDTSLLPGEIVPKSYFQEENEKIADYKTKTPAKARELLVGITKVSLSTDSWLSSASFQRTSRSLANASVSGQIDNLYGLKENVIVGRLIPAGTGWEKSK